MIPDRLRSLLNSVLWVLGAVMIGGALNTSVVTGSAPLTAPGVMLQIGIGTALVVLGYTLRPSPAGLPGRTESDEPEEGGPAFDPDLSPVGDREDEPK